jgi:hypothetical protein
MVSGGEMRYDIKLQTPWKKYWPISAGYRFELFSIGYYRYAGGGSSFSIGILNFELNIQRWPRHVDHNQAMTMQMGAK